MEKGFKRQLGLSPEEKAERAEFAQPGDLALYTVPVRDTPNGMDGWVQIPEADPVQFARAKEDGHEGFLFVRVSSERLCQVNRPDEVDLQEEPS